MDYELTRHAQKRQQQRAVPPLVVYWLTQYGATEHDHRGAQIRYFDKRSKKALAREVGEQIVSRLTGLLDAYLVMSDQGAVITMGYRYKRLGNH